MEKVRAQLLSLRQRYATALPRIRLFESTAKPAKISAMLRVSSRKAVVFRRGFGGWFFRHYTVLFCIPLFGVIAKTTSSAIKSVAASSAMAPVTVQTVASRRGFGGCICEGEHMAGKLKPLDVERKIRPGKFCASW